MTATTTTATGQVHVAAQRGDLELLRYLVCTLHPRLWNVMIEDGGRCGAPPPSPPLDEGTQQQHQQQHQQPSPLWSPSAGSSSSSSSSSSQRGDRAVGSTPLSSPVLLPFQHRTTQASSSAAAEEFPRLPEGSLRQAGVVTATSANRHPPTSLFRRLFPTAKTNATATATATRLANRQGIR